MKMVMVVNNQPHNIFFGGTKLIPGVNSVPAKVAEEMKKNAHIKGLCAISGGKNLEITKDAPSTKGLDLDGAAELVGKTHDPKLLKDFEREDARPAVAQAIAEQRDAIAPTEKKS